MINLSKSISEGELFLYLWESVHHDGIIIDFECAKEAIPKERSNKIISIGNKHSIREAFHQAKENWRKNLIIILSKLNLLSLQSFLDQRETYTLINLFTGIGGFWKKIMIENEDLILLGKTTTWVSYFFPSDEQAFYDSLQKNYAKKYIRLSNIEIPKNKYLRDANEEELTIGFIDKKLIDTSGFTTLNQHPLAKKSIIFTGELLSTAIQVDYLSKNKDKDWDIFVIDQIIDNQLPEALQKSIKSSKEAIIVADQNKHKWETLFPQLDQLGINFRYLLPQYQKLTTFLEDYQYEEAEFDAKGIFKKLEEM